MKQFQGLQPWELQKLEQNLVCEIGVTSQIKLLKHFAVSKTQKILLPGKPPETKRGWMNAVFKLRMRSIGTTPILKEIDYS